MNDTTKRKYVFQCASEREMLDAIDFVASDRTCRNDEEIEMVSRNGIRHIATKAQWKQYRQDVDGYAAVHRWMYGRTPY